MIDLMLGIGLLTGLMFILLIASFFSHTLKPHSWKFFWGWILGTVAYVIVDAWNYANTPW